MLPTSPGLVILLVEDSEDDVLLFRRTLRKSGVPAALHLAEDGRQAMHYLAGTAPFADRRQHPLPDLVLLDLKLPHVGGFEVLRWIRAQPAFDPLCVVLLTSSPEPSDVATAYAAGANSYLTKPITAETLRELCGLCRDAPAGPHGTLPLAAAERPPAARPPVPHGA